MCECGECMSDFVWAPLNSTLGRAVGGWVGGGCASQSAARLNLLKSNGILLSTALTGYYDK